ncbi:MAG: ABC transporter substrate-binding protein [Betaproteobacteria bacterium]|nr:MAG: ABC transporter substrate-binding protein [Betaproteobacteria bacterium]
MNRRTICRILAGVPMVLAMAAAGQSPAVLHVAWVSPERAGSSSPNLAAFRAGMRELGYIERKNLVIETWWGEGSGERLEQMAGDIVRAQPDVIVTGSGLAVLPMMRAGVKLPIVFVFSADPVEAKIVATFARPGGNLTGMSLFSLDLMGKRLEFLKEAIPGLKRIAIIANPEHAGESLELKAAQEAAAKLGLSYHYFPVRSEREFEQALASIERGRDEAILAFADGFTMSFAERIATFSVAHKVPAVSGWALFVQRGNLMSYGPVIDECYRRLAVYVDKIYKGARPADLPVELPTKLELVINLKTAKALGLTIPQSLLLRTDEIIQ